MPLNIESIIANGLLELCDIRPLDRISITSIQEKTGISRQTFYNHFKDKQDLIQHIYSQRVVVNWKSSDLDLDFYDSIVTGLERYSKYHRFLKQACCMNGQNNLKEYMLDHCEKFDYEWHLGHYGKREMPEDLRFAVVYHSAAAMQMKISWILKDMPCSMHDLAVNIIRMRDSCLSALFWKEPLQSPYAKAMAKAALMKSH